MTAPKRKTPNTTPAPRPQPKQPLLSCSTSWNYTRHTSAEALVAEILGLGFDAIELGHGLKAHMVHELLAAQAKMGFQVSSLHNYCPLPPEISTDNPDCYEYTSHRPADRNRATRLTLQTIDMAVRFGAKRVVIHSGRIRTLKHTRQLRKMVETDGNYTKEYAEAKLEVVQDRESHSAVYVKRSLDCLRSIVEYAASKEISLGFENREDYEAVPSEREFPEFLAALNAPNVRYWHDFGHAQIKANLGLIDHEDLARRLGPLALGCHVHDVRWPFTDHQAPFKGEIAYERLLPFFPKDCVFVFELHHRVSKEDIVAAVPRWRQLLAS